MTTTIDSEEALAKGLAALKRRDPLMRELVARGAVPPLRRREPGFAGLAGIIVSQQLSVASATAIWTRLATALDPLHHGSLIAASDETLRAAGLSAGKIRTLRAVAEAIDTGALPLHTLAGLPAEAAHGTLTAVKGIGPWTADIYLLFCLGHPDIIPAGDLALREAARAALALAERPDEAALRDIAERWRPWRGVAARVLWAYYKLVKQGREGMALASP
jgi:DNA-3-methyladenine glycosylase II